MSYKNRDDINQFVSPAQNGRNDSTSRRDFIREGASFAAAATLPLLPRQATSGDKLSEKERRMIDRLGRGTNDVHHRMLLKGGTIISMDPKVGNFQNADLLIEGKRIVDLRPGIKVTEAEIIDASNTILIPGLVDAHRHSWEGQLRRINPNASSLDSYQAATHKSFALSYRPHDMYVGNLITALGCIDSGITCIIDNSHNSRSADHSDEAIRALFDSGIRAVHASGKPLFGTWDEQWPLDLKRLKKQYFSSDDQLVTLRMFGAFSLDRQLWAFARSLGLHITTECFGTQMGPMLDSLWKDRLLGPDNTFNHCNDLPDTTWEHMRDAGVTVNVCPRSDSQYALGVGIPAYQKALDHGVKPGFSVDNETSYSGEMFTEMRVAFYIQRALATNRRVSGDRDAPTMVSPYDVLECATVNGAICAGLLDKVGSLTPGKEADIVMLRTNDINLYPSNNAIGTVVNAADIRNVDTVIIGGEVRKFRGAIVGLNMGSFIRMVDESREYLFDKRGIKLDMFAPNFKT